MKSKTSAQFCALALIFISVSANAMDEEKRRIECALLIDPSDISTTVRAIRQAQRAGEVPNPRWLIRVSQSTLDTNSGRIFMARDHRPPGPEHLEHIRAEWQAEAAWWYHPAARDLQAGDQFVTRNGEHRWTKVIAGSKEIWRGPDGLLVGDVFGQLNHYDALLIDRALAQLYAQAIQENGQWKWPEGFDPATFLRQEMGRSVTVVARWLDDPNNGSRDVARFFDPLMASIGGILEPDVPWRLPLQQGYEMDAPDPTREFSALRNQSAPEVLNDTSDRWLWSSSVHTETLGLAYRFSGRYGYIDHAPFNYDGGSVRLVARWR